MTTSWSWPQQYSGQGVVVWQKLLCLRCVTVLCCVSNLIYTAAMKRV
jgi:hypothetical protein